MNQIQISKLPHISDQQLDLIKDSLKFQQYLEKVSSNLQNNDCHITVTSLFMFGKKVGFITAQVEIKGKINITNCLFIRGKAVGILVIINETYILTVNQFRVPVSEFTIECPAGMIDENGDFQYVAAQEIEEETGLKIDKKELQFLGSYYSAYEWCDQEVLLYYVKKNIDQINLDQILRQSHGNQSEGEQIRVQLTELSHDKIITTKDSKLMIAFLMYSQIK